MVNILRVLDYIRKNKDNISYNSNNITAGVVVLSGVAAEKKLRADRGRVPTFRETERFQVDVTRQDLTPSS